MKKPTAVPEPAEPAVRRSYTWLFPVEPDEILQPIQRVEGPFKEAWAKRMAEPTTPIHRSKFTGQR